MPGTAPSSKGRTAPGGHRERCRAAGVALEDALGRAIDPTLLQKRLQQGSQFRVMRSGGAVRDFKKSTRARPGVRHQVGRRFTRGVPKNRRRRETERRCSAVINFAALGVAAAVTGIVVAADKLAESLRACG